MIIIVSDPRGRRGDLAFPRLAGRAAAA